MTWSTTGVGASEHRRSYNEPNEVAYALTFGSSSVNIPIRDVNSRILRCDFHHVSLLNSINKSETMNINLIFGFLFEGRSS